MPTVLLCDCLSYSCDCSQTAFTGPHCETPLPPCYSEPCFNSAICKDHGGNYTCECWPGKGSSSLGQIMWRIINKDTEAFELIHTCSVQNSLSPRHL